MVNVFQQFSLRGCEARSCGCSRPGFALRGAGQIEFCSMSVNQHFSGWVSKVETYAVHINSMVTPMAATSVRIGFPSFDDNLVNKARCVADRGLNRLFSPGFALNLHETYGNAPDQDFRRACNQEVISELAKPLIENVKTKTKSEYGITSGIIIMCD